ncbi:MAG: hypothetical protein PHS17_13715 [Desulfobacterales bacterium]|nr:hypothetical protein [Desulfobacterales bacterium]
MNKKLLMKAVNFFFLFFFCFASAGWAQVPAFPGAEGFGATSLGGRGKSTPPYSFTVHAVTNLNNSGAGSFRAAVEASGPRFVVFKIGGTIALTSGITISNPYIYIAGQTAPGGGITIRGGEVRVQTHNVTIRYLTFRRGAGGDNHALLIADNGNSNVHDIIVDHCTLSWGTDEVLSTWYRVYNFTSQWNIVSEGLDCSTHSEGCHSKGGAFGGWYFDERHSAGGAYNLSVHHNLFAHNRERNPVFDVVGTSQSVNNVSYNMSSRSHMYYDRGEFTQAKNNVIKNFTKAGPASAKQPYTAQVWKYSPNSISWGMYVEGNIDSYRTSDTQAQEVSVEPGSRGYLVSKRFPDPTITETSAAQAYKDVLASAGNYRGLNCDGTWTVRRDAHDLRIVSDVTNRTGKIINDPSEVGGWLTISSGTPCTDTDSDGMPDVWETASGLNPNNSADRLLDSNGNGYTNLERFLNGASSAPVGERPNAPTDLRYVP